MESLQVIRWWFSFLFRVIFSLLCFYCSAWQRNQDAGSRHLPIVSISFSSSSLMRRVSAHLSLFRRLCKYFDLANESLTLTIGDYWQRMNEWTTSSKCAYQSQNVRMFVYLTELSMISIEERFLFSWTMTTIYSRSIHRIHSYLRITYIRSKLFKRIENILLLTTGWEIDQLWIFFIFQWNLDTHTRHPRWMRVKP